MFLRRLGPSAGLAPCAGGHGCPDLFELTSGDFAVIGTDITDSAIPVLPPGAGCGPGERIVSVPRRTLVLAKPYIPSDG